VKYLFFATLAFLCSKTFAESELTNHSDYNVVEKAVFKFSKDLEAAVRSGFGAELVITDTLVCHFVENVEISGYTGACTVEAWPAAGDSVDFLIFLKVNVYMDDFF